MNAHAKGLANVITPFFDLECNAAALCMLGSPADLLGLAP